MTSIEGNSQPVPVKNRYADAPRNPDWTIDQNWASYSAEEHERWDRLFARQSCLLPGRACDEFLAAMARIQLSAAGVPNFAELSRRLQAMTGWSVVPVAGLVPNEVFFEHLANRRFPAGAFIRPEHELDYIEEPDVFHDVFGHVPLLANPTYANFLEAYGQAGNRAMARGQLDNLARLYWYTVEFGLMKSGDDLRLFGAGIMSSPAETVFALEDTSPHRIAFSLERVMRTLVIIDDFQKTYFVVDSFERLLEECEQDFEPLYDRLRTATIIEPHELVQEDKVLVRGDMHYFRAKATSPPSS
jgi:phenylalanine-4-hydroxylase